MTFVEDFAREFMPTRTIRAWHYTRLLDAEVDTIRKIGLYPSTLETLRQRQQALVDAGILTAADRDALYEASPFHQQESSRSGRFWMVSEPVTTDDTGVELLLGHWGGEATYFWQRDERLVQLVASIGEPRILEIAVPIAKTREWYSAGKAAVAAYARTLGCRPDRETFGLYSMAALGPETVMAIHTAGDEAYEKMAHGYSFFLLVRDIAGSDLVGWIDRQDTPPVSPVFVFGMDENGKPQGARFTQGLNDQVVNAALDMNCRVIQNHSAAFTALGMKLPVGRVYASGKAFIPNRASRAHLFARHPTNDDQKRYLSCSAEKISEKRKERSDSAKEGPKWPKQTAAVRNTD
jgi:hypothetical protein